uniref:Uncharacterized protein n=1 Tax=Arundo donax TaxID=35708 RepID=A0A0A9DQF7_ARUDO
MVFLLSLECAQDSLLFAYTQKIYFVVGLIHQSGCRFSWRLLC